MLPEKAWTAQGQWFHALYKHNNNKYHWIEDSLYLNSHMWHVIWNYWIQHKTNTLPQSLTWGATKGSKVFSTWLELSIIKGARTRAIIGGVDERYALTPGQEAKLISIHCHSLTHTGTGHRHWQQKEYTPLAPLFDTVDYTHSPTQYCTVQYTVDRYNLMKKITE